MYSKILVGSASRYIAGRNAVQTVYWRTCDKSQNSKMVKVAKTLHLGSVDKNSVLPPIQVRNERITRFD